MGNNNIIQKSYVTLRILRLAKFAVLLAIYAAHAFSLTSANFADAGEPIVRYAQNEKVPDVSTAPARETHFCKLLYVVDGDTIKIEYKEEKESVRLLGIDTPESRNNAKAEKDAKASGVKVKDIIYDGIKASKFTKEKLEKYIGKDIEIEFGNPPRDRYGRLLGWVYVEGKCLNVEIVRNGYAKPLFYGKIKYKDEINQAYDEAVKAGVGLWRK